MYNKINFGSTFRIPVSQPGVNSSKKLRLKQLVESYPNGLIGNSKTGYARVSVSNNEDNIFISKLKNIGYKRYQIFEGENIPAEEIDIFIKERLKQCDYTQAGCQKKRKSNKLKNELFQPKVSDEISDNSKNTELKNQDDCKALSAEEVEKIRIQSIKSSKDYLYIKTRYGEAVADELFLK